MCLSRTVHLGTSTQSDYLASLISWIMEYSGSAESSITWNSEPNFSAIVEGAPELHSGSSFILSAYSLSTLCLLPDELSGGIVTLLSALILGSPSSEEDYALCTLFKSKWWLPQLSASSGILGRLCCCERNRLRSGRIAKRISCKKSQVLLGLRAIS